MEEILFCSGDVAVIKNEMSDHFHKLSGLFMRRKNPWKQGIDCPD